MKTFIVLVPVESSLTEPRKACEGVENMAFAVKYAQCETTLAIYVLEKLLNEWGVEDNHDILVIPITDFMDMVNNDDISFENYYMSYVNAKIN